MQDRSKVKVNIFKSHLFRLAFFPKEDYLQSLMIISSVVKICLQKLCKLKDFSLFFWFTLSLSVIEIACVRRCYSIAYQLITSLLNIASTNCYHLMEATHAFYVYLPPLSCFELDIVFSVHCSSSKNTLTFKSCIQ